MRKDPSTFFSSDSLVALLPNCILVVSVPLHYLACFPSGMSNSSLLLIASEMQNGSATYVLIPGVGSCFEN